MKNRFQSFRNRIAASLTYRGIAFTTLWCVMFALRLTSKKWFIDHRARQFDRRHDVDTHGVIQPKELGLSPSDVKLCVEYEPCAPEPLSEILSNLNISFEDYQFVDLGSGKGMALLVASLKPFKRIVGVEWSRGLATIARENARKFIHQRQKCREIIVVDGDAAAFELPDAPLVIWMFNPFKEAIVRHVLDNLRESLARRPRHVIVVYYNPKHEQAFEEAEYLRLIEARKDYYPVTVYESKAAVPKRNDDKPQRLQAGGDTASLPHTSVHNRFESIGPSYARTVTSTCL
jgi:hypothetical protein